MSCKVMKKLITTIFILIFLIHNQVLVLTPSKADIPKQDPVLFITGLGGTSSSWNNVLEMFKIDDWPNGSLFAYDFEKNLDCSDQGNINNANQINQWVNKILKNTDSKKVDIIAYSMGGISSRYFLKFLNGTSLVDDYVSIASPQHGSAKSYQCDYNINNPNELIKMLNDGDETPNGLLNDTIGERYDSILNVTYSGSHIPGNINYTCIYSPDDDVVIPYNTSRLDGAINIPLNGYLHNKIDQAIILS